MQQKPPFSDIHYTKNLEKFSRDNPLEAYRLENVDCSTLTFCYTEENELNLTEEVNGRKIYLHDQAGAIWAARQWAKQLRLGKQTVIFVYGLGLGYYYLPLKEWLEDPTHYLVFLEDDKRVLNKVLSNFIPQHPSFFRIFMQICPIYLKLFRDNTL